MIKLCNPMINLGPRCSVLYFFIHGCQNLSSGSTNFHRVTNFAGNNLKHRNTLVPSGAVAWSFICHIFFSNIFPSSSSNRFVCAGIHHIYYNIVYRIARDLRYQFISAFGASTNLQNNSLWVRPIDIALLIMALSITHISIFSRCRLADNSSPG